MGRHFSSFVSMFTHNFDKCSLLLQRFFELPRGLDINLQSKRKRPSKLLLKCVLIGYIILSIIPKITARQNACPILGRILNDHQARAFSSPIVVEVKLEWVKEYSNVHIAAFILTEVLKTNPMFEQLLSGNVIYILIDKEMLSWSENNCVNSVDLTEEGQLYMLFLDVIPGAKMFKMKFPALQSNLYLRTKVKQVLCTNCSVRPKIKQGLKNTSVRRGSEVVLTCIVQGLPGPIVEWKKNNISIDHFQNDNIVIKEKVTFVKPPQRNKRKRNRARKKRLKRKRARRRRKRRFESDGDKRQAGSPRKKKRPRKSGISKESRRIVQVQSSLHIKEMRESDVANYSCYGVSVLGDSAISSASLSISEPASDGVPCGANLEGYCMNGGACYSIPVLNERFCKCQGGYEGHRCEKKSISISIHSQSSFLRKRRHFRHRNLLRGKFLDKRFFPSLTNFTFYKEPTVN